MCITPKVLFAKFVIDKSWMIHGWGFYASKEFQNALVMNKAES